MTIAMYLRNLDEEYQLTVYRAVRDAALAKGCTIVCVQQDSVGRPQKGASPSFPLHDFLKPDGVLLLSSVILGHGAEEDVPDFVSRFERCPCVSIGHRLPGIPSLIIRSRSSMEYLMEHLVNGHGYRKFLYIGGPPHHRDNAVREHVFRRWVNEQRTRLADVEGTVVNGTFEERSGGEILRRFIESRPDRPVDAVVAANDNMAIGALRELRTLKGSPWNRCAITGFDDIPQAALETPSLTTVRQPLDALGHMAVLTLCDAVGGIKVPPVTRIDSTPVVRDSCGCPSPEAPPKGAPCAEDLSRRLEEAQYQGMRSERNLRSISYFGQALTSIDSVEGLCGRVGPYLDNLGVRSFHIILFPGQGEGIPGSGRLVYRREGGVTLETREGGQQTDLADFLSFQSRQSEARAVNVYHLTSEDVQLGLLVYEAEDFAHPYICSMAIFISNTLRRLELLAREKERARILEREVALRTADLVLTNRRLAEEAKRRLKVEAEVLRISEMERLRFSLDLHDDICQRLAGISMYCKALSAVPREIADMVDETLGRTRRYAHESFPVELDDLGLDEALRGLCASLERNAGISCGYRWDAGERSPLSRAADINAYRIVQEALQNVAKHSKASRAEVSVERMGESLTLRIRDDGTGSPSISTDGRGDGEGPPIIAGGPAPTGRQLRRQNGLGLTSMKYRAHQLGSAFSISSSEEGGTLVTVEIPLSGEDRHYLLDGEMGQLQP